MVSIHPIFGTVPASINERLVFVLMPFKNDLTNIYNSIVKPVIEGKNFVCRRADDYKTNRAIIQDIWEAICESRIVIADMTYLNPNVMYEIGIAHTVGKNTIIMYQPKMQDLQFPFDLAHIRRIEYEITIDGGKKLERELGEMLESVLKHRPLIWSIIQEASVTSDPANRNSSSERSPAKGLSKTILVESTKIQDNIKLTLHAVYLDDQATIAYLSIENSSQEEIYFSAIRSYVVQHKTQYRYGNQSINNEIPPGIEEEGYVYFQPVRYIQGKIRFNFELDFRYKFIFEIEIVPN